MIRTLIVSTPPDPENGSTGRETKKKKSGAKTADGIGVWSGHEINPQETEMYIAGVKLRIQTGRPLSDLRGSVTKSLDIYNPVEPKARPIHPLDRNKNSE